MHKLFVYGTLKQGFGNSRLFRYGESKLIGPATTVEHFILMDFGGYPGMYEATRDTRIKAMPIIGELWECDDKVLGMIDGLEGHPNMYRRTPIQVRIEDKNPGTCEGELTVECETYIYQGRVSGTPCIDGVWPRNK